MNITKGGGGENSYRFSGLMDYAFGHTETRQLLGHVTRCQNDTVVVLHLFVLMHEASVCSWLALPALC